MIYLLRKIVKLLSPYIILNKEYRVFIFSIFFIILSGFSLNAQDQKIKVPLTDILVQLENTSDYQFTYANDIIEGFLIVPPPTSLTFKEKINYLEKRTGLLFQFLNAKFIAIKAQKEAISICGYLLDKETRMPLEAVAVIGVLNQTTTNDAGFFKLEVNSQSENIDIRY